jgi:hypothetical protein
MVPRHAAVGRLNLGDRAERRNLTFLAKAFAAIERGGGIGVAAAVGPGRNLADQEYAPPPNRSDKMHIWQKTRRP